MGERGTVVLLEEDGTSRGAAGKLEAHRAPGELHLAFSVFLYRRDGTLLLQQRALDKYHFPGVWANACCSHPQPGEDLVASAERRVAEELGIACRLRPAGQFVYRATCPTSGLVEHELDHVLLAVVDAEPRPDPHEVAATAWFDAGQVLAAVDGRDRAAVAAVPAPLAPWLGPALRLAEVARAATA